MQSVTSNAVAEALKYKNDWQIGQIIETDDFFQGKRLKHYCNQILKGTGGQVIFQLPERPNNIIDLRISAVDARGNVLQDGYCDVINGYYLRCAWMASDNIVVVAWTGWSILKSIFLFFTYR